MFRLPSLLFLYDLHARIFDAGHDILERLGGIVEAIDRPSTALSVATIASTFKPVINLMSSTAKTLVGSAMAMVKRVPALPMGITRCFWTMPGGIKRITSRGIVWLFQVDVGDAVLFAQAPTNILLLDPAEFLFGWCLSGSLRLSGWAMA